MTPLRRRMIEDLQLRGYSERTVEAYVHAVAQLARFYGQSPDQLSEEQIRRYLLHLTTVKKVARGTRYHCSLRYQVLLRTDRGARLERARRRSPAEVQEAARRTQPR